MTDIKRPVLRYHGGKWKLAPWVIAHFPAHRIYVEGFGGGGSILMRKSRSYAEVYNDRSSRIVSIFRVLRDPVKAAELRRRIDLTPFARDEFAAIDESSFQATDDEIERARMLIFRSFSGFGSNAHALRRKTGFRGNSDRTGTTPAGDWRNYSDVIPAFVERLRGVVIENRDALDVMRQHDTPETLHYADPPYVHSSRSMANPYDLKYGGYEFEMSDEEHAEMARSLRGLVGMVIVSGYRCGLYDEIFDGWSRIETIALADGARMRTECLWLNPACQAAIGHGPLFDGIAA